MTTVAIPDRLLAAFDAHCDDVVAYVAIAESWPEGSTIRDGAVAQAARSMALADALLAEAHT